MVVLETANLTEIEFSDLYSRKIVGWEVWKSEDAKHASEFQKDGQSRELWIHIIQKKRWLLKRRRENLL